MPYTAGLAADLSADRYGAVLSKHRHTRRFVRPIKETGKRPRPDRMGLGLFFCKVCRKIMPPGGARVLRSAHHDAAVVFGGVALSGAFAPLPGLRHPASAALRLRLAGRGPNSDSLFPPLAAVVAVAPRGRGTGEPGRPTLDEQSFFILKTAVPCYRGQQLRNNILVKLLLISVAGHYFLRYIKLSAVSFELSGLPMAPPLGELSRLRRD